MTIMLPPSTRSVCYTATAGQTALPVPFPVLQATDLTVTRRRGGVRTPLALSSDYVVTGVGQQTGAQVALQVGALAGDVILIEGNREPQRQTSIGSNGPIPSDALNADATAATIEIQELRRDVARAIRRGGDDTDTGSLLLPAGAAGCLLGLDADGGIAQNFTGVPGGIASLDAEGRLSPDQTPTGLPTLGIGVATALAQQLNAPNGVASAAVFSPDAGGAAGQKGLVPPPGPGDAAAGKILSVNGWELPPSSGGNAAGNIVYNQLLFRTWQKLAACANKAAAMYNSITQLYGYRCNLFFIGDSFMPGKRGLIHNKLSQEYGMGGFAGRLAGENGFVDDGNAVGTISLVNGDFTNSPNGVYWAFSSGSSKYFAFGSVNNLDAAGNAYSADYRLPADCNRVGIWFTKQPSGGSFTVTISNKQYPEIYLPIAGLTSVSTSGSVGVIYTEVQLASAAYSGTSTYAVGNTVLFEGRPYYCYTATSAGESPATAVSKWRDIGDLSRIKIDVAGGAAWILGGLVGADSGVYGHSWNVGGLSMTDLIHSPRWPELCATFTNAAAGGIDCVFAAFSDAPGDSSYNTSWTETQLVDYVMNGLCSSFPSSIVPSSTAPSAFGNVSDWTGKSPAIAAVPPEFVLFGEHLNQSVDVSGRNVALRAKALALGICYVDTASAWATWQYVWDRAGMSPGDSSGTSTHMLAWFDAAICTRLLHETHLIGTVFTQLPPQAVLQRLAIAPRTSYGQAAALPGYSHPDNKFKVGGAHTNFSAGPFDLLGFGTLGCGITSDDPVYGCSFIWRSTAANGTLYMAVAQPGAGFKLVNLTDNQIVLSFNNSALSLAPSTGSYVSVGPRSHQMQGIRSGQTQLTAGTVTISDINVTGQTRIVVSRAIRQGTPGVCYETSIVDGVSFTITARTSGDAVATGDTSYVDWIAIIP
jgi:hypothetical protein